jgi:acetyl esterase/lipase
LSSDQDRNDRATPREGPLAAELLRTLTANEEAGTVLAPVDRTISIGNGSIRLRTFAPDGPVRGVMLRIHGGGWAAGAPEDDDTLNDAYARTVGTGVRSVMLGSDRAIDVH